MKKRDRYHILGLFGLAMIVSAITMLVWSVNPLIAKAGVLFIGGFIVFAVGMSNAD